MLSTHSNDRALIPLIASYLLAFVNASASPAQVTSQTSGWFEWVMPGLDDSQTAVDLSRLNAKAAGVDGFVQVRQGHFVDGNGQRVRYLGTNLTAAACFPDKGVATKVAARFRKLGFNVVRFHFMDVGAAPKGIFLSDNTTLDPAQIDRLDFFIAQLKANGIYANLNLHVARRYPGIEGEVAYRFEMGKVLDRFYPPFFNLQRDYARALLTHINPYTGHPYTREPALLCVEMNNENTLLPFWGGNVENLPQPFGGELDRQWLSWLAQRYGTTANLRTAWAVGEKSVGPEVLRNGDFQPGAVSWTVQEGGGSLARLTSRPVPAGEQLPALPEKTPGLRWEALEAGRESWSLQLYQGNLAIKGKTGLSLSFWGKAAREQELDVTIMADEPPWNDLGLYRRIKLAPSWTLYHFDFQAKGTGTLKARVNFNTGNKTGTIDLAAISLHEAGLTGLPAGQSLEAKNLSLPGSAGRTPAARLDYWTFLVDTERKTAAGLRDFLKKDLGVRSLVCDTQANYGEVAGVLREAAISDFVDMHGYWQHPHFIGKSWDFSHWTIENTAQVKADNGGTLGYIAMHRISSLPYTVSEYNIPAPSDYGAETLPMLAAIAAFQDWDALYLYTYLDFRTDWEADHILGFFDFCGNPGKLAFAPAAALAFRRELIVPGREAVTLKVPREAGPSLWARNHAVVPALWEEAGVPQAAVTIRRLQIEPVDGNHDIQASAKVNISDTRVSDTGEITWESGRLPARFTVNSPAMRCAIGALSGRRIQLGDVILEVGSLPRDYACVALVSLDEKPIRDSQKVLVTVAARVENQDMGWNSGRTTVGSLWGKGPTLAEVVPAQVTLPGTGWKVEALDGTGKPIADLSVKVIPTGTLLQLSDSHPTLWYLATR